jgi:AcrR family transcriptional regulator
MDGDLDTRARILREARKLFMPRGYADVAVGEIASAVGVTKPTLYYHFGDKQGLYTEVICALVQEVGGYIRQVTLANRPVRERLEALARGYFLNANYAMEPMLRDATELLSKAHAQRIWETYQREIFSPLEELMRDGARRGELRAVFDPAMLTRTFLGLLEALTAPGGHAARSEAEHAAVAHALVELFVCGAGT